MMDTENIFSALAKYGSSESENYLTEAFVFLLNTLLTREPAIALQILTSLCVNGDDFSFVDGEDIQIKTQVVTPNGTPDIAVCGDDKLIYIEVKDESEVDNDQLRRYKEELGSHGDLATRRLILLTRYSADASDHGGYPDKFVRWFEVYNWLGTLRRQTIDESSAFLMQSFNVFLEEKGMSIQRVGWEYIEGVPAFIRLLNMIEVAIDAVGVPLFGNYPRPVASDYRGFYLGPAHEWFIGVYYSTPLVVVFEVQDKTTVKSEVLRSGNYSVKDNQKAIWLRLSLPDAHFFSLDKDQQLEALTAFVREGYGLIQQAAV